MLMHNCVIGCTIDERHPANHLKRQKTIAFLFVVFIPMFGFFHQESSTGRANLVVNGLVYPP